MSVAAPSCFDPELLARLEGLSPRVHALLDGLYAGGRRGGKLGLALEFSEHRPYAPGDDIRNLDWKALARTQKLYVRSYEAECNVALTALVDASGGMAYRGARSSWTKLDCARTVTATLCALALAAGDAAGAVTANGDGFSYTPASSQRGQLRRVAEALEQGTAAGEIKLARVCDEVGARLPRRGLVAIASDLLDANDAWVEGVRRLTAAGHQVIVLHVVDRDELVFPFSDAATFADLESREKLDADARQIRDAYLAAAAAWRRGVAGHCADLGAAYQLVVTDARLDRVLAPLLDRSHG